MNYHTETFTDASQLLEYLNPLNTDRWPPSKVIFRGQPRSELDLHPSIYRLKGPVTAPRFYGYQDINCSQQVKFEKLVIRNFLEACDQSGLRVPGDSPQVREEVATTEEIDHTTISWPDKKLYEVLAFAQHHGVPTCLLDWTYRSYVAAYFAAASALGDLQDEDKQLDGALAIWALSHEGTRFEVMRSPGGTSPYLAAQSGLFTVSRIKGPGECRFIPMSLEQYSDIKPGDGEPARLQCLTLPRSEAAPLLEGCARLGVSGAKLFPGYEGIAKSVRDWANIHHKGATPVEDSIRYIL